MGFQLPCGSPSPTWQVQGRLPGRPARGSRAASLAGALRGADVTQAPCRFVPRRTSATVCPARGGGGGRARFLWEKFWGVQEAAYSCLALPKRPGLPCTALLAAAGWPECGPVTGLARHLISESLEPRPPGGHCVLTGGQSESRSSLDGAPVSARRQKPQCRGVSRGQT